MSEVASMVGVPLTTDKVTQDKSNHNFARVLIEVDVSKPPQLSFPIRLPSRNVFKQFVVYETFPSFCFHCKEYGHHPFICKILAEKEISAAEPDAKVGAPESTCCAKPNEVPEVGIPAPVLVPTANVDVAQLAEPNQTALVAALVATSTTCVELAAATTPVVLAAAQLDGNEVANSLQFPEVVLNGNESAKNKNKIKKKKRKTGRPRTFKSGARAPKRIENESSGWYETDSSKGEDLVPERMTLFEFFSNRANGK
ncbi:unnamed protein product [Cuscuta europaea]|uniref:Zinc knuckle CX2CX4HX4C domain-containing protein n=1 Tax=Cuscuta europaea TaxID=41803 RepID=A0A9P1EKF4_CUSEU|nr:unnamed protein product [Cuscuta europaea]